MNGFNQSELAQEPKEPAGKTTIEKIDSAAAGVLKAADLLKDRLHSLLQRLEPSPQVIGDMDGQMNVPRPAPTPIQSIEHNLGCVQEKLQGASALMGRIERHI